MKNIISLLLALVMCLSVCACAEITDDCKALLGDTINLDNFDAPDADDDSVYIWRTEKSTASFDFTIAVENGPVLELNGKTLYQNLLDLGWESNMPEVAEAHYSYFNSCYLPDGKWFTISLSNPTENNMAIAETYVSGATFTADASPNFDLSGLHFGSTVADVVSLFGEPYYIYYSELSGLNFKYEDDNFSSLECIFDANGLLIEAIYSYNGNFPA